MTPEEQETLNYLRKKEREEAIEEVNAYGEIFLNAVHKCYVSGLFDYSAVNDAQKLLTRARTLK